MNIGSINNPIDISMSGLRAQGRNMEIIHSNVANARTTDAGKGEPYRRLEAVMKADKNGVSGVNIDKIVTDNSAFETVLDPGNPDADEHGYVLMPNVNLPVELMNLTVATRAYQANTAILKRYQKMVESTLELLR